MITFSTTASTPKELIEILKIEIERRINGVQFNLKSARLKKDQFRHSGSLSSLESVLYLLSSLRVHVPPVTDPKPGEFYWIRYAAVDPENPVMLAEYSVTGTGNVAWWIIGGEKYNADKSVVILRHVPRPEVQS